MTIDEVVDLLTTAAAYDRRTVGEADAIAWHAAIGDLPFEDSRAAVVAHYRESREWLMPADVRQRVKEARRERILDAGIPAPPPELGPDAYGPALQAAATAIADGRDPEAAMRAIARQQGRPELEAP
jgi:hypothetical protein